MSAKPSGQHSVAPSDILQAEHDRCQGLWVHVANPTEHSPTNLLPPPQQRAALERLTVAEISEAALSHATGTASTYDGFHPRHFALLGADGLRAMAAIWEACELSAMVPRQIRHLMAPLIPKATGGYRDSRACQTPFKRQDTYTITIYALGHNGRFWSAATMIIQSFGHSPGVVQA